MTVATTGYIKQYTGNAATTSFSFPYYLLAKADLDVYLDGVLKTLNTHYTLAGTAPFPSGLNVVFGTAPGSGVAILIERTTPNTQDVNLSNMGDFDQEAIESMLDKAMLVSQENGGLVALAVLAPTSFSEGFNLPEPSAGTLLKWNDDEDALENTTLTEAGLIAIQAACEAAETAAELAETNAETAETNAETAETNAETAAGNASTSASAASTSASTAAAAAASASAIANGDLFAFANTTGNFTAINNAAYYVDDGAQITLPAIGTNVNFRVYCKTQPPVTGVTFLYTSNTIQGLSSNVTVKNTGVINCFAPNATTWMLTKGSMSLLSNSASNVLRAVTGNSSILVDDDTIVATISADATLTLYNPALTSKVQTIKNAATSTANITIARYASESIEGVAASYTYIYPGQSVRIQSTGSNWVVL